MRTQTTYLPLLLSGEAPCHPSLLDQEPVPSGVDTQTVRADMFMASSEINIGIHHHQCIIVFCRYEPRERCNSVMSTLSSRMRQFGPSRDYPYALPGEFSEEEQEEAQEEESEEENTEEEKKDAKEEIEQEEPKEEQKKESENEETASVSCSTCSCSVNNRKISEKAVVEEKEKVEENKDHVDVKETPKIQDLNLKRNPMKTMIAAKIDRGNHISSRFY